MANREIEIRQQLLSILLSEDKNNIRIDRIEDVFIQQNKQAEEIEAVELINWMHSKKADKSYKKGYWFIEINKERMECSAKQLYEIFKNQK